MDGMDELMRRMTAEATKEVAERAARQRQKEYEEEEWLARQLPEQRAREAQQRVEHLHRRAQAQRIEVGRIVIKFLAIMKGHGNPGSGKIARGHWRKRRGWHLMTHEESAPWSDSTSDIRWKVHNWLMENGTVWQLVDRHPHRVRVYSLGNYGNDMVKLTRLAEILAENGLKWE